MPKANGNKKQKQEKQAATGSLAGYNIVLDPGHGGSDPGAIGLNGVFEKDLINSTTEKIAQQLRNAGATVILTRTDDYFISLDERIRISNAYDTHAFISIHYNAFPMLMVQGMSTHYSGESSRELAQKIQASMVQHVNLYDRGAMPANYQVLRESRDLAVLVELGFITNPLDLQTIQTADYQNKVAEAITAGLKNYFHE